MLCGAGTDIVATGRIAALIRDRGAVFLERWFTAREIEYCCGKAVPSRHFAARFAAKEAVVKALPMPWEGPLPWRSIEIVNDRSGAPSVRVSGAIRNAAMKAGVVEIMISLSHCDEYATATALATTAADRGPWTRGRPVEPEVTARVLRDSDAVRQRDTDSELEAVCTAILVEDVFGVVLSDAEIDPAVLADPSAVAALVSRRRSV